MRIPNIKLSIHRSDGSLMPTPPPLPSSTSRLLRHTNSEMHQSVRLCKLWLKVLPRERRRRRVVGAHRSQLVKAGEQLVQRHDQLLGRALRRQAGEALDVCKQYAAREVVEAGGEGVVEGHTNTRGGKGKTKETENEINQYGVELVSGVCSVPPSSLSCCHVSSGGTVADICSALALILMGILKWHVKSHP